MLLHIGKLQRCEHGACYLYQAHTASSQHAPSQAATLHLVHQGFDTALLSAICGLQAGGSGHPCIIKYLIVMHHPAQFSLYGSFQTVLTSTLP
jgi:hypothetical protein